MATNVTISLTSGTGETWYAFPDGGDWANYTSLRVALAEGGVGNTGRYSATVDADTTATKRFLGFQAAGTPASIDLWKWSWDVADQAALVVGSTGPWTSGSDWTANERTAIRTILGVPPSGTTPATPSDGALADILAALAADPVSHTPVINDSLIVVVEDDTYDGTKNSKIAWTVSTDYTGATITFHVWRQNSDGSRTDMLAAPIAGTVVSSVRVELATFTATFNAALKYSGLPAFEKLQFACVATASSKEYTVAIGDLVVKERR